MNTNADNIPENKSQSTANSPSKLRGEGESAFRVVNNEPKTIAQRKFQEDINNNPSVQRLKAYQEMANNSPQIKQLKAYQAMSDNFTSQTVQRNENLEERAQEKFESVQKKANNTGLPDNLKSGIENISGYSLDDVKVHRNSDKPAQLNAQAYARGTEIHLASGQEKHLPHEAWHVVQQKQGRVKPVTQLMNDVAINHDAGLETEADVMGAKAIQMQAKESAGSLPRTENLPPLAIVQRKVKVGGEDITDEKLTAAINSGIKGGYIPKAYFKAAGDKKVLTPAGKTAFAKLKAFYTNATLQLSDDTSLMHQAGQDMNMIAEDNDKLMGIGHQNSQFVYKSKDDKSIDFKSGVVEDNQRVYRTMTLADWQANHIAGHGGAIGQAMHYFNLGKAAHEKIKIANRRKPDNAKKPDRAPDLLVEFTFTGKKLTDLVSAIEGGGEGKASTADKLGGKTEQNTAFGRDTNIFSVDLKNASGLLNKDFVTAKVLDSTNGVMPATTEKAGAWQKRPG